MYQIVDSSAAAFEKLHPIKRNVKYKLWNPVKNGVIMFDPSTPGSVFTSGGLDTSANGESENVLSFSTHLLKDPCSVKRHVARLCCCFEIVPAF